MRVLFLLLLSLLLFVVESGKWLFSCISLASFYEGIGNSADPDKTRHNTDQDLPTVCLQNLLLKLGNTTQHP